MCQYKNVTQFRPSRLKIIDLNKPITIYIIYITSGRSAIMKPRVSLLWMMCALSFVISPALEAFASTDQTTTERILRENKRFVDFINICATNFAETKKDDFRKAFEKHFNADIAYLQSDYKRAYRQIYDSQGELEKLYHDIVKDSYLEDSKTILDKFAPGIIRSKN